MSPLTLLDAAVDYARRGWPVFPLEPGGKRPLGRLAPHGLKDATTDLEQIERWWTAEPDANIGLPTGINFDVLDVDGPEALDALERSGPIGAPDVEGPTVATPRGWHGYVARTGRGNTVNLGGLAGVDWRGEGGYVVAPPSRKADGGTWDWIITGSVLDLGADTPIEAAPAWVLALFERRSEPVVTGEPARHAGRTGYGAAALEGEAGKVLMAPEGSRNHALNVAAFSLGQLVAGRVLGVDEVINALLLAAARVGLGTTEARATIASGLEAGSARPRSVAS